MLEIRDLEPLYEFVNKMSEKGYECDFKINTPEIAQKEYFDSDKNKIKEIGIHQQEITINLYKNTIKKS